MQSFNFEHSVSLFYFNYEHFAKTQHMLEKEKERDRLVVFYISFLLASFWQNCIIKLFHSECEENDFYSNFNDIKFN
jgi:hypothetical protein